MKYGEVFTVEKDISVETRTDKGEYSVEEEVKISVTVTNRGMNPVELIFMSAQRYDFIVVKDDREVWRWSKNKMFAMVLESLLLKPGEKQTYMETWEPKCITPGEYEVIGTVTSRPAHRATCVIKIN
jgi:uncharacterized membrane protein